MVYPLESHHYSLYCLSLHSSSILLYSLFLLAQSSAPDLTPLLLMFTFSVLEDDNRGNMIAHIVIDNKGETVFHFLTRSS